MLPAIAYRHRPGCAVAGGYIVRDPHLARIRGREIFGDYVFGDYCTGRLYGFRPKAGRRAGKQRSFRFNAIFLTSIGEDNTRHIYLITERGPEHKGKPSLGSVYRLVPHRKQVSGTSRRRRRRSPGCPRGEQPPRRPPRESGSG